MEIVKIVEIVEIAGKVVSLILGFGAIARWIVTRIERGQKAVIEEHRRDFKRLKKELKKRVSHEECRQNRENCPLCKNYKKEKV